MVPTMATMATTNVAVASLDSKWTPLGHILEHLRRQTVLTTT